MTKLTFMRCSMYSIYSNLIKEGEGEGEGEGENENKVLIGKRSHLYRRLSKIRGILPGAFSIRKVLCGKSNCVCKKEGKRHTAYQYSYRIGEKQVTMNIPKQYARQVEKQVLANKEFNKIIKQIHEINLKLLFRQLGKK